MGSKVTIDVNSLNHKVAAAKSSVLQFSSYNILDLTAS